MNFHLCNIYSSNTGGVLLAILEKTCHKLFSQYGFAAHTNPLGSLHGLLEKIEHLFSSIKPSFLLFIWKAVEYESKLMDFSCI